MKSLKAQKFTFTVMAFLATFSGCSSLVDSNRDPVANQNKESAQPKWVSREQYDQLMSKYKNLLSEHERLKENRLTSPGADLLGELQATSASTESVDVFGKNGLVESAEKTKTPEISKPLNESDLSKEIQLFKKAIALKEAGKQDDALKIFQVMEKSYTKQIRARARYQIANIYYGQAQFDLALQVTETIISDDAFSAIVLDAIKIALDCCEKLGLEEKKLKYNSILVDVFGVTG
jgi:tetratricopeptide (TPR) repeat protein